MKKPLKLSTILWLAGTICTLFFGGCFWLWNESTKADLAAAQERCRAAGLPMTIDAIRPPSVPDADNAALVIEKLAPLLERLADSTGERLFARLDQFKEAHPTYLLNADGTKELATLLETQPVREVMALIQEATSKSGYDARIEYEKGPEAIVPNIIPLEKSSELLGWHARLAASRGRAEEACTDFWQRIVLVDFGAAEPFLLSQLVRWSMWRVALEDFEQLVTSVSISARWNQKFTERLTTRSFTDDMIRALDFERLIYGGIVFEQLLDGKRRSHWMTVLDFPNWKESPLVLRYQIPGLIRLECVDFLEISREQRRIVAQVTENYPIISSKLEASVRSITRSQILLRMLFRSMSTIATKPWNLRAKISVAQVGLALERYRMAKGEYPATLAELAPQFLPEVPVDIFTDKPLIYRPEPGGAVVYSVGRNLKDDGGVFELGDFKDDPNWASGTAAVRKFAPPAPATPPPATETPPLPTTATPPPATGEAAPLSP